LRLKTAIWVSAFLRRCMVEGLYGAVVRKGAEEAGAVYVIVNHLDGTFHLFGPAPGPSHDEEGERRWSVELEPPASMEQIDALLERKRRFDPDIWVVEIEDRKGTAGLVATA
jgi:hypothetical protein